MVDPPLAAGFFPTTCWSQVGPGAGEEALEQLARRYWRPIRDWLRAERRLSCDAANELTQDFFLWTIESGLLAKADRERGRFRTFLKTALRNYATDAHRREAAARRGGGRRFFSLEDGREEGEGPVADVEFDRALPGAARPDELLDRRWRRELLEGALRALERELAESGRERMFAIFRDYFLDPAPDVDYRAVAGRHGVTVTDVANGLARAKRRFRDHLRAAVVETVRDGAALEEELRWLFGKEAS